jgi:NitT/TauT family transport system permease protein
MRNEAALPQDKARTGRRVRLSDVPTSITSILLLVVFLAVWEGYVRVFDVSAFLLPPPSLVVAEWIRSLGTLSLWFHTWITAYETILGFVIAAAIGVALGAVLGKLPKLEQTLNPFIIATQVVPKVALVPLLVVWFGFGLAPKVIIAAVLAFFPILLNTILGIKSVDRGHREVLISVNASRWQEITQLEFPSSLPYILTGMEIGIVLAIIGAVVGEYLGGNQGLGNLAVKEMNSYNTTALFAVIIHLSLLGFIFYALLVGTRRFVIPWHESVQIDRR